MWPLLSGGQPVTVAMHDAPIKEIAWIPEMNLLATGSWDKTLKSVIYFFPLYLHIKKKILFLCLSALLLLVFEILIMNCDG